MHIWQPASCKLFATNLNRSELWCFPRSFLPLLMPHLAKAAPLQVRIEDKVNTCDGILFFLQEAKQSFSKFGIRDYPVTEIWMWCLHSQTNKKQQSFCIILFCLVQDLRWELFQSDPWKILAPKPSKKSSSLVRLIFFDRSTKLEEPVFRFASWNLLTCNETCRPGALPHGLPHCACARADIHFTQSLPPVLPRAPLRSGNSALQL